MCVLLYAIGKFFISSWTRSESLLRGSFVNLFRFHDRCLHFLLFVFAGCSCGFGWWRNVHQVLILVAWHWHVFPLVWRRSSRVSGDKTVVTHWRKKDQHNHTWKAFTLALHANQNVHACRMIWTSISMDWFRPALCWSGGANCLLRTVDITCKVDMLCAIEWVVWL